MSIHWEPQGNIPDLTGKVFVVTGTSPGGIGREIAKHLALGGGKVYCTARSEAKSEATVNGILKEQPTIKDGLLLPLIVEFESPESVQDAVAELKRKETKLDVLVNNAGILAAGFQLSETGWEKQMTINYLGHYIFVNGLMPLLRAAVSSGSDVRVINVASNAVAAILGRAYEIDFSDPQVYRGIIPPKPLLMRAMYHVAFAGDGVRYAVSKLAFMMFTAELQRRFDEEKLPILSVAVNPGTANSHGRAPSMLKPALRPLFKWITVTPEEGSWNALFFATAKEARNRKHKGKYHEPVAVVTDAHPLLKDEEARKILWDATEGEINEYFRKQGRPELGPW